VPLSIDPADFGLACEGEPDLPMFGPPRKATETGDNLELGAGRGRSHAGSARRRARAGRAMRRLLGAALILKDARQGADGGRRCRVRDDALESGAPLAILERLRSLA
jgi:hypothetical protein